jgi:hypothetical protein
MNIISFLEDKNMNKQYYKFEASVIHIFLICQTKNTTTCFEHWIYLCLQVEKVMKDLLCWAIYK